MPAGAAGLRCESPSLYLFSLFPFPPILALSASSSKRTRRVTQSASKVPPPWWRWWRWWRLWRWWRWWWRWCIGRERSGFGAERGARFVHPFRSNLSNNLWVARLADTLRRLNRSIAFNFLELVAVLGREPERYQEKVFQVVAVTIMVVWFALQSPTRLALPGPSHTTPLLP